MNTSTEKIEKSWQQILMELEQGKIRSATCDADGVWHANLTVKKAILEAFKAGSNIDCPSPFEGFVDKGNLLPRYFSKNDGVRMVPGGSSVRRGAYVSEGVIIMPPSYLNVGAFVDKGTMVDSHVLVGSCAQVGKNVHLSAGVQIGGVLEPIGETPVVIEDDVFVGANVVIVEGVVVKKRAVIAPSVMLSKSVPVYDCVHEKLLDPGAPIPEGALVIPGSRPLQNDFAKKLNLQAQCPVIVKYRDEKSDASLKLEDWLR